MSTRVDVKGGKDMRVTFDFLSIEGKYIDYASRLYDFPSLSLTHINISYFRNNAYIYLFSASGVRNTYQCHDEDLSKMQALISYIQNEEQKEVIL